MNGQLRLHTLTTKKGRIEFQVDHAGVAHKFILPTHTLEDLDGSSHHLADDELLPCFERHRLRIIRSVAEALVMGRRGDGPNTVLLAISDFPET